MPLKGYAYVFIEENALYIMAETKVFAIAVGITTVIKSAEKGAGSPNIKSADPRNMTPLTIVPKRLRIAVNICFPFSSTKIDEKRLIIR